MKYSQSYRKTSVTESSTECNGNSRGYSSSLGPSSNNINGFVVKERLLEKILDKRNFVLACDRVVKNRGVGGVDGMSVDELRDFLNTNWPTLRQMLMDGKYHPSPVLRVEIPKDNGKKRKLGIPTAVDRVIQQAIAQVLTPIYEPLFSENSYGFRPQRRAHDAIAKCVDNLNAGYCQIVDMDLEKYFDTVNHDKLITILSKTIKDGRVISLINRYLNAGVEVEGEYHKTIVGVPQGGPLSPILSNIMLNELDRELEQRGHRFVRYADDVMIFCKSSRGAQRVMKSVTEFIEGKLKLKVNRDKTVVAYASKVKFLGFGFYFNRGGAQVRVHPKSVIKMKNRMRELLSKTKGHISNDYHPVMLRRFIMGWVNYFKIANMKQLMTETDQWMRAKIRCRLWKQWKKIKTRYENLVKLGMNDNEAYRNANTRKGYWRIAHSPVLSKTLSNEYIKSLNYIFFLDYYKRVKC